MKIAGLAVETAEKSAIYAQRAYITASIEKIEEGFQFHLRIENNGNTPANDVRVSFSCRMNDKPPYDVKDGNMIVYDSGFTNHSRLGLIAPGRYQSVVTPKRDPQVLTRSGTSGSSARLATIAGAESTTRTYSTRNGTRTLRSSKRVATQMAIPPNTAIVQYKRIRAG